MFRVAIGSIVGGIAQWIVGFLFWGTPLAGIALKSTGGAQDAAVQTVLAQALTPTGTGTYVIPSAGTSAGAILHGRGPVAMIHFNTAGFPATEPGALLGGLVLSIVTLLLLGIALYLVADRVRDFETRAKLVVLTSVAATLYFVWGQPVYTFFLPWPYFVYLGLCDFLGLLAGGLIVARWFLPGASAARAVP